MFLFIVLINYFPRPFRRAKFKKPMVSLCKYLDQFQKYSEVIRSAVEILGSFLGVFLGENFLFCFR